LKQSVHLKFCVTLRELNGNAPKLV